MSLHAADRLIARCRDLNSRVCVGLDPHLDLLPPGLPGRDDVARCRSFLLPILDALQDVVPVVKPQIAFFEALGTGGWELYFEIVREAHRRGLLVIGDIKRSDIGSTASAYARAHLGGPEETAADWVTINPYLGEDSIAPFLALARPRGRGVFVLVRTSNPSSRELQCLFVDGAPLFREVGRLVQQWGKDSVGGRGFSDVGAVVGATHPEEGRTLREALPRTLFLVPGYGAQGGTASDVAALLGESGDGAVVSSSRSVLFAYRAAAAADFASAAREAALSMGTAIDDAFAKHRSASPSSG